jgi:hypothetical protein
VFESVVYFCCSIFHVTAPLANLALRLSLSHCVVNRNPSHEQVEVKARL